MCGIMPLNVRVTVSSSRVRVPASPLSGRTRNPCRAAVGLRTSSRLLVVTGSPPGRRRAAAGGEPASDQARRQACPEAGHWPHRDRRRHCRRRSTRLPLGGGNRQRRQYRIVRLPLARLHPAASGPRCFQSHGPKCQTIQKGHVRHFEPPSTSCSFWVRSDCAHEARTFGRSKWRPQHLQRIPSDFSAGKIRIRMLCPMD